MGKRLIFRYYLSMRGNASLISDVWEETCTISCVNLNKSREYYNDENLIKSGMSISYEVSGWYLELLKRKLEKILSIYTKNQHWCFKVRSLRCEEVKYLREFDKIAPYLWYKGSLRLLAFVCDYRVQLQRVSDCLTKT